MCERERVYRRIHVLRVWTCFISSIFSSSSLKITFLLALCSVCSQGAEKQEEVMERRGGGEGKKKRYRKKITAMVSHCTHCPRCPAFLIGTHSHRLTHTHLLWNLQKPQTNPLNSTSADPLHITWQQVKGQVLIQESSAELFGWLDYEVFNFSTEKRKKKNKKKLLGNYSFRQTFRAGRSAFDMSKSSSPTFISERGLGARPGRNTPHNPTPTPASAPWLPRPPWAPWLWPNPSPPALPISSVSQPHCNLFSFHLLHLEVKRNRKKKKKIGLSFPW